jgi:hypothetical protein
LVCTLDVVRSAVEGRRHRTGLAARSRCAPRCRANAVAHEHLPDEGTMAIWLTFGEMARDRQ